MKLLICYDDSECARIAVKDLPQAGFPADTQALVLTATENWMPISDETEENTAEFSTLKTIDKVRRQSLANFAEARAIAKKAAERISEDFPGWAVRHEAVADFPVRGILAKAEEFQPDLIIVGSHGRRAMGRFFLGSVSLKVLSDSPYSVRVARRSPARTDDDDSPMRIIIGVDGSTDSVLAVKAVTHRSWQQDSAVRLASAVEPFVYPLLERDLRSAEEARKSAVFELERAGLHVSSVVRSGAAKDVLIKEAEDWAADAVFVGAKGHQLMQRALFGSVSYAVAARAACSVEVVRYMAKHVS